MELLIAQRLTRLLAGAELVTGVNLRLASGDRLGLVGPNGSGKSTLLRTLAGLEAPDDGRLWRAPGVRVGYLPQGEVEVGASGTLPEGTLWEGTLWEAASRALAPVRELERRLREGERRMARGEADASEYARLEAEFELLGGFAAESRLRRDLAAAGFTQADDDRAVAELSAGERRRLALAQALALGPDLLILDEPTNHLDLSARLRLASRLAAWPGALVVVSHDRALLDASTTRTAFLEPPAGGLAGPSRWVLEPGAYSVARERREGALRQGHRRAREREKEAARLEAMAAELATFGRKAQARKRAAERQRTRLLAGAAPAPTGGAAPRLVGAPPAARRRRAETLLEATGLSAPPVLADARVTLKRGERIALLGPNGSGKSTLLALLSGARPSSDPRAELRYQEGIKLRHVGQVDRGLADARPLWEQVVEVLGPVGGGRLLAGAGLPPHAWHLAPTELSGGERARAGLALAFSEDADLWLIDEPTNDLDLAAVEALEEQLLAKLEESGAALVLATHDRRLAERLTTEVWAVAAGRLERYGAVADYLAGAPLAPAAAAPGALAHAPAGGGASAGTGTPGSGGGVPAAHAPAPAGTAAEPEAALEDERQALLRLRDEHAGLTERERRRLEARLAAVEEELMAAYAARLPPAAPRYRLVEGESVIFADELPEAPGGQRRLAVVVPQPAPARAAGAAAALALDALASGAPAEQALLGCAAAWLEVRLVDGVGHLRLHGRAGACPLPYVSAALVNAGTRLAFTRLGASAVQLHHPGALPGVDLTAAGDDWWSLGLGDFLVSEGWRR